jgi:hypothetical protein
MSMPGPETKKLAARYYARFGQWPPGLILVLGEDPVPSDVVEAAERLRKIWLRVDLERELRDEIHPPNRKTVTWVNDDGETVSVDGYETAEEAILRDENEGEKEGT